jgi:quinol monooxygenase YgiN
MRSCRLTLRSSAIALALLASAASPAPGQQKPNPLVAQVRSAVKDPGKPFILVIRFQAKEGAGPKLEAAFARAVALSRREKGCLAYDLSRDAQEPTRYVIYERWQDVAALEAHQNAAHIAALRLEISDLRTGPPEAQVLLPVGE